MGYDDNGVPRMGQVHDRQEQKGAESRQKGEGCPTKRWVVKMRRNAKTSSTRLTIVDEVGLDTPLLGDATVGMSKC